MTDCSTACADAAKTVSLTSALMVSGSISVLAVDVEDVELSFSVVGKNLASVVVGFGDGEGDLRAEMPLIRCDGVNLLGSSRCVDLERCLLRRLSGSSTGSVGSASEERVQRGHMEDVSGEEIDQRGS